MEVIGARVSLCVCNIAVQVHAGKRSDGRSIVDRGASVCTSPAILFHCLGKSFAGDDVIAEEERLTKNIMSRNPLQKLIVRPQ